MSNMCKITIDGEQYMTHTPSRKLRLVNRRYDMGRSKTGKLTKVRSGDEEQGVEPVYHYTIGDRVFQITRHDERYTYMRRNARFASVGYRRQWVARIVTDNGVTGCEAFELSRRAVIAKLERQYGEEDGGHL